MRSQSFIIALDDIRSHHNVGSIFRSSDAFGIELLLLGGISPKPPHREIQKTALGATESVAWKHCADLITELKIHKQQGARLIALEQTEDSIPIPLQLELDSPLLLIFGNEVRGVRPEVLEICDAVWEIPQQGIKKSLNVSVCAGICMHLVSSAL